MEAENMNQNPAAAPQGMPAPAAPAAAAAPASAGSEHRTLMAVLSYIGILVIIPYIMAKNDPFVAFHVRQGIVLAVIEIAVYILGQFLWALFPIWNLINLLALVLSIVGIIHAVKGEEKEVPLVGAFGRSVKV